MDKEEGRGRKRNERYNEKERERERETQKGINCIYVCSACQTADLTNTALLVSSADCIQYFTFRWFDPTRLD